MNEDEQFLRVYRAKSWEKRARGMAKNGKKDLDGEFIFWWIALNALYGQPRERDEIKKKYRERSIDELQNLKYFLEDICKAPEISNVLKNSSNPNKKNRNDVLENPFLRKECWNRGLSTNLLDSQAVWESIEKIVESTDRDLQNGRIDRYLKPIFERLYVLRNQIFHGASKDQSRANRRSLTSAVSVLGELVPVFIKAVESHGEGIRSDGIPYPPFKGKKSSRHSLLEQDFQGPSESVKKPGKKSLY